MRPILLGLALAACESGRLTEPSVEEGIAQLPTYLALPDFDESTEAHRDSLPMPEQSKTYASTSGFIPPEWLWQGVPDPRSWFTTYNDAYCGSSVSQCLGFTAHAKASTRGNRLTHEMTATISLPGGSGGISQSYTDQAYSPTQSICLVAMFMATDDPAGSMLGFECKWNDHTFNTPTLGSFPAFCNLRAHVGTIHRAELDISVLGVPTLAIANVSSNRNSSQESFGTHLTGGNCLADGVLGGDAGGGANSGASGGYRLTICNFEAEFNAFTGEFLGINELGCMVYSLGGLHAE